MFDPNPTRRTFTSFVVRGCFSAEVMVVNTLAQAISIISNSDQVFDFMVCHFEDDGAQLMREVFSAREPVHFICSVTKVPDLSQSQKLKHWVHFLPSQHFCQDLLRKIDSLISQAPSPPPSSYTEVPLDLLVEAGSLPGDVYVRQGESYVPAMKTASPFHQRHAEILREKGNPLYVASADTRAFARALQLQLFPEQKLEPSAPAEVTPEAIEKSLQRDFEGIQDLSARVGFTPEVQEITRRNVLKTIGEVRKAPKLANVLKELNRDPTKYISSHSMLLAHVACAIATEVDWKSDATFQKLTLAAFLHDITLKNQKLAAMPSLGAVETSGEFSEAEKKAYKFHPSEAAEIARGFDEVPPDVDIAIAQHHERPDGSGFPRGLTNTRISPLSCVFIVAHDVVDYLLSQPEGAPVELKEIARLHPETYQAPTFRRLLAVAEKLKR